jgi:endonuclease YncB( thermonuclease family)
MPCRSLLLALILIPALLRAEPVYDWKKLEGCTLVESRFRDGDSFHVKHQGKDYIFRLYFVDTPEDESRFPDRIAEQAAYFGISSEQSLELGQQAADFTSKTLGVRPFTVWTLWQDAMGASAQPRFYAIVKTNQGDLAELLVKNGLARIYGKRIELPDKTDSRAYLEKLAGLKEEAIRNHKGGWAAQ